MVLAQIENNYHVGYPRASRAMADVKEDSRGERASRAALKELFPGKQFHKTRRVPWLHGLELDGYNEELGIAVEYQGKQHYEYIPFFHRNGEEDLDAQLERDAKKAELCTMNMICLIIVPHDIPIYDIRNFIYEQVADCRYLFSLGKPTMSDEDFLSGALEKGEKERTLLERAQAVAVKKGGVCLSDRYFGSTVPLKFKCGKGHEFKATLCAVDQPDHRGPRFCPDCGGTKRRIDEELKAGVESCGYTFVSLIGPAIITDKRRRQMKVACPEGHEYEVLLDNFFPIKNGRPRRKCIWCERKRTNGARGEAKRNAAMKKYGLETLDPYGNRHIKVRWKCTKAGHISVDSWHTIAIRKHAKCLQCGKT